MAKKRKATKPEAKFPVDPNAQVFAPGDEIEVIRHNILWADYKGVVESVNGGLCVCRLWRGPNRWDSFTAHIPATELKLDL